MHVEQGYNGHVRDSFELNIKAQANQHRTPFPSIGGVPDGMRCRNHPPKQANLVHFFLLARIANSVEVSIGAKALKGGKFERFKGATERGCERLDLLAEGAPSG
jgi:hypothetical protein